MCGCRGNRGSTSTKTASARGPGTWDLVDTPDGVPQGPFMTPIEAKMALRKTGGGRIVPTPPQVSVAAGAPSESSVVTVDES